MTRRTEIAARLVVSLWARRRREALVRLRLYAAEKGLVPEHCDDVALVHCVLHGPAEPWPNYEERVDLMVWAARERVNLMDLADWANSSRAPAAAATILYMALPHRFTESVVGDLDEEYATVILPRTGHEAANRWYRRQVALTLVNFWILRPIAALWNQVRE